MGERLCDGFVSLCLRVCDVLCLLCDLCVSVVLLVFAKQRRLAELARDEIAGAHSEETD